MSNSGRDSNIGQEKFNLLLEWLDPGEDRARVYEKFRQRLMTMFACRGCADAEELADETIDRAALRIEDLRHSYVGDPARYLFGVAMRVHQEGLHRETEDAPDIRWEETLREAQENRELLFSLMDSDWRGLELLMLLETLPQGKNALSAQLRVDEEAVTARLSGLMQAGAIEKSDDLFWCTGRGSESLQRIQALLTSETPNGA